MSDNGNGTYTNPLFYDEFSDPDVIRVGDDYFLTGTTMHTMPGLPVLHSRDLVNWEFLSYAAAKLDYGPECRLEAGKDIYGRGFWAPSLRFHDGTFYIFSNINGRKTQKFTASSPEGPWSHEEMMVSLHDLSVLFDDDGTAYVVWGYDEIRIAELNAAHTDLLAGTEKVIIPKGTGAGEGSHFYKIDGKYFILMTHWDPVCYQVCARAEKPWGPYEITVVSAQESFGISTGWRIPYSAERGVFEPIPPPRHYAGCTTLHQGGIVQTQAGEWWACTMMDHNSVGRLTCLSPVTWEGGWPYLGLPGNLTRSPLTWVKPRTSSSASPGAPYDRCDDFAQPNLKPVWQWNHTPRDANWSLTERKGHLILKSLPATDFLRARNTLTQRAIGPVSVATTVLDGGGLRDGDIAGLALLNFPYSWIGISRDGAGFQLRLFDQCTDRLRTVSVPTARVWLRVRCDFDTEFARFSYSTDGTRFTELDDNVIMAYQLKTFQGVRYALFNYNTGGATGGSAFFDSFEVIEPRPWGIMTPIPYGEPITLTSIADSTILAHWKNVLRPVRAGSPLAEGQADRFRVVDRGQGRVALRSEVDGSYVSVEGSGRMSEVRLTNRDSGDGSTFQWIELDPGVLMLMSLKTHRYLCVDPRAGSPCSADSPGPGPDRKDGPCFAWARTVK